MDADFIVLKSSHVHSMTGAEDDSAVTAVPYFVMDESPQFESVLFLDGNNFPPYP